MTIFSHCQIRMHQILLSVRRNSLMVTTSDSPMKKLGHIAAKIVRPVCPNAHNKSEFPTRCLEL